MSSARDVKRGCSVSVLNTGHLKEPGTPLEAGRFLYPARTPTNTSHGAESTLKSHSIQLTNYKKNHKSNNYNNDNNNGGDNDGNDDDYGYVNISDDYDNYDDDNNTNYGYNRTKIIHL